MAEKISLTRALVEVKNLNDRIARAVQGALFVTLKKGRTETRPIMGQFKDVAESENRIKADIQSVEDLIARRQKIKSLIAKANVENKVTINGQQMSIAEAIDMKVIVGYKQLIIDVARRQLTTAANNVEQNRSRMEADVQASIERLLGADAKTKAGVEQNSALIESTKKAILDMHDLSLIDPLDIKKKIDNLTVEVGNITSEIDFVLSEANAKIEIEL